MNAEILASAPTAIELTLKTLAYVKNKADPIAKKQIIKWSTKQRAEKLRSNIRQIGNINTIASKNLQQSMRFIFLQKFQFQKVKIELLYMLQSYLLIIFA